MKSKVNRRRMLGLTGRAAMAATLTPRISFAATSKGSPPAGAIVGEPTAAKIGAQILADGGNAVDAIVGAALVAAVVSPHNCGIGGYGGHATIALAGAKRIASIDFNSTAPAAARADMFPLDANGAVSGKINEHGWLAAGVPGVLAGLELALQRFGTKSFRELVRPAIELARNGFPAGPRIATATRGSSALLRKDPASAKLLLKNGEPYAAVDRFSNPDLAQMLQTLADKNSVDDFYRGDIAQRIADAFKKNGGLVTAADLAAYRAREVEPLKIAWRGFEICTAPLTAGGLTIFEAALILQALDWDAMTAGGEKTMARVEALRAAWEDRLRRLGDPEKTEVPVESLLSKNHAGDLAEKIRAAIQNKTAVPSEARAKAQPGTVNLSCADTHGNMAALTLTHGNSFGAGITVEGLGLTLGHGMSRFEARPGHPNSVAPGKRPLHNMCPTIVLRDGKPLLAVGGAGGRKIPNSVFDVLINFTAAPALVEDAVAAPRMHTEGDLKIFLEKSWPESDRQFLPSAGYQIKTSPGAVVGAVLFDAKARECRSAWR